tara:strand:- start:148 stop:594 length:447 start_codon:yes stop_codon:yes gene_type:complete
MKKSELQQLIREELNKTLNENSEKYMFFQNLETIKKEVEEMLRLDPQIVDAILANGHDWAADHISTSKDDIEEVHNFLTSNRAPMDELSKKQQKIAKAAPPEDKITGEDFAALRKEKSSNLSESQQLQSLEQQAKDFVSKYGKVKVKI